MFRFARIGKRAIDKHDELGLEFCDLEVEFDIIRVEGFVVIVEKVSILPFEISEHSRELLDDRIDTIDCA